MTRATLLHLLAHPTTLGGADVRALEELAEAFPYCQTAHLLLAKAAHDHDSMLAAQRLRRAATYATDRAQLRRLMELPVPAPALVAAEAATGLPEAPPAPNELPNTLATPPATPAALIDQPGQELAPQPVVPEAEPVAEAAETSESATALAAEAPTQAIATTTEAASPPEVVTEEEVLASQEATASTEAPAATVALAGPPAPDTPAAPETKSEAATETAPPAEMAARETSFLSEVAVGDEDSAAPADDAPAEATSPALVEAVAPAHDAPAPTEAAAPAVPSGSAAGAVAADELTAETVAPADASSPAAELVAETAAPAATAGVESAAASEPVAELTEPSPEAASRNATEPAAASEAALDEAVPTAAGPLTSAEAPEPASGAPVAEAVAEAPSLAPAPEAATPQITAEAAPAADNEELPAQAPPVRPPAEAEAARHEFGLAATEPAEAEYELPELAITIPLTLADATPLLPPFGGLAGVGYAPGEGSRLGYCLVLTDAASQESAADALPPTGEFFAPDALLLLHLTENQPPTSPRPNSLQLIDSFLRRSPSVTRRRNAQVAGISDQADLSVRSTRAEPDLASESLATILAQQGKTDRAIAVYERLMVKYPEKMSYFAAQIESLRPGA